MDRRGVSGQRIQAVLWDMDGTLVQTELQHQNLELEILASAGIHIPATDYKVRFTGQTTRATFTTLFRDMGLGMAEVEAALTRKRAQRVDRIVNQALPVRGIEMVLRDIPMRTHRFALVTSAERGVAEPILERFGWTWRFETVVTADDVTHAKPHPEPYRLACERLGLRPERCVAVEDSPHGIASAQAAGCLAAGLCGTFDPKALGGADFVLSNVGAVPGLLGVLG